MVYAYLLCKGLLFMLLDGFLVLDFIGPFLFPPLLPFDGYTWVSCRIELQFIFIFVFFVFFFEVVFGLVLLTLFFI